MYDDICIGGQLSSSCLSHSLRTKGNLKGNLPPDRKHHGQKEEVFIVRSVQQHLGLPPLDYPRHDILQVLVGPVEGRVFQ